MLWEHLVDSLTHLPTFIWEFLKFPSPGWGPPVAGLNLLNTPDEPSMVSKSQPEINTGCCHWQRCVCHMRVFSWVLRGCRRSVLAFKVPLNSRTSTALWSEGAVLPLFIIQWLLYHTMKNERKYISQQHIYSESTNVFQLHDPRSFSRQL